MATYRVLNLETDQVVRYTDPRNAAVFLMGKLVSNYAVIKTDELGTRVAVMPEGEVGRDIDLDRVEEAIRSQ